MTTSNWNVSASGDWSDASDWSGGVPNGSSDDAVIAQSGTYTVTIGSAESFTIGSVTLNDADATLAIAGTLDLANTLTLTAGTLNLTGTIDGGTIDTESGTFTSDKGTLVGVTVDGTVDLDANNGNLYVQGGTIEGTVNVGSGENNALLQLSDDPVFEGAGGKGAATINLNGLTDSLNLQDTITLSNVTINIDSVFGDEISDNQKDAVTYSSSVTINAPGNSSSGSYDGIDCAGSLANKGTINIGTTSSPDSGSSYFPIVTGSFANSGTVVVENGAMLELNTPTFSNTGTIQVESNSLLEFAQAVSTAGLGAINVSSGVLYFFGGLNNAGATFVSVAGESLAGTITGGTIEGAFTVNADDIYGAPGLTLSGSPIFEGAGGTGPATIDLTAESAQLNLSSETLDNANVDIGSNNYDVAIVTYGTLNLGPNFTITQDPNGQRAFLGANDTGSGGSGTIIDQGTINADTAGGRFLISASTFENDGTIHVTNGDDLAIQASESLVNNGTISVDSTSTLELGAALTTAQLGTLNLSAGATIAFGDLQNTGATFVLPDGVNVLGQISGGTLEGTLNVGGVGLVQLSSGVTMEGSGGSGPGTINVTAENASIALEGPGTFADATINLGNTEQFEASTISFSCTLASNVTIDQSAPGTYAYFNGAGGSVTTSLFDGTLNAASQGGVLNMGGFTNNGTIAISNGDTVDAGGFVNDGTITIDGSSMLELSGTITPAELGGTILAQPGAIIDLQLDNSGATFDIPTNASIAGTITGGTIEGTVNVASNAPEPENTPLSLVLAGDITFEGAGGVGPGIINSFANAVVISSYTPTTISDATINAGGIVIDGEGSLTLASNTTVNEAAKGAVIEMEFGLAVPVTGSFTNDGTINADSNGGTFTVAIPTFANGGTISISNGATFDIAAITATPTTFDNTGTIDLGGTSTLEIDTGLTTTELGTLDAATGATLLLYGTLNNTGATLEVPNPVNVVGTIEGGTIQGTLDVVSSINTFTLEGDVTMVGAPGSGSGTINVTGGGSIMILSGGGSLNNATVDVGSTGDVGASVVNETSFNGSVYTLGSGTVIEQTVAGTVGFLGTDAENSNATSSGTLINDGTIISDAHGSALGVDPAELTNNGLIEAANGGKIALGLLTNLSGTTLTGGTYEAGANSTFEFVNTATIVSDDATIILGGASSVMEQFDPLTNTTVTIESTLTSVGSGGELEVLGGGSWSSSGAFVNAGTIALGGGTFSAPSLANSGTLSGFGTFDAAIANSGSFALIASGGTLNFSGSFSDLSGPTLASGITLGAEANSTLQLPNGLTFTATDGTVIFGGPGAVIQSLNGSNEVSLMSTLVNIGTTGALEVVGDGNFTSSNAIVNAGTIQLGGGTFSAGTLTNSSGATLEGFGTVAAVVDDSGTTTSSGGTLAFTASGNAFAAALGGTEVEFNGGSDSLQSGASLTAETVAITGSASLALGVNESFAGVLDLAAGSITIGANTLTLSGAGSTLAGAISGTGSLALKGGSQTIGSGAVLSVSSIGITSSDAVTIAANASYGGSLSVAAGTTITVDTGDTLTLSGTTTLNGTIGGTGTLSLGGGTLFADSGAVLSTNQLVLGGTATLGLKESLTFAGVVSDATGTSIAIGTGLTLTLTGTGSALDGTVTGKGTLLLDGGTDTLKGATMQVSDWTLSDGATATFGTDITYAGVLTEESGTTLSLGSKALNLSGGSSDIAGAITGTAALNLEGGSQEFDAGATISTAHWNLTGKDATTIDEDLTYAGAFSSGNGTKIAISAGDTLDLTGAATVSSKVSGAGTLELSGGTDVLGRGVGVTIGTLELVNNASVSVDAVIKDTGALSLDATSSLAIDSHKAFDLTAAATGSGTFVIDANATLEFSSTAASTLTANFDGADAILKLADISGFGATISGFAVGDTIDLMHHGANSAVLDGNELVVKHNATVVATLQLSGDYTGYTFETSSDGHSGTDITLIAPPEGNSGLHIVANTFSPDWHLG